MCNSGGGALFRSDANPTVAGVVFAGNFGRYGGGAYCYDSSPTFIDCTFWDDEAVHYGGGMRCSGSSPIVRGCTFAANSGPSGGGGLYLEADSHPLVERTIVAFSTSGEAIYCSATSSVELACCDLYGNAGGDWTEPIADQYGQEGNIAADPLFCDLASGDLRLQSDSPCLYSHHPGGWICGLIGAHPVGCPVASVPGSGRARATWGALKSRFASSP